MLSATDLGWDDWAVLLLLCVGVPSMVIIDKYAIPYGAGSDIWAVPFDHITKFVRWLYVLGVLYFLQIALLKLSILLFLLRIFPRPLTKRLLKATIAFNLLYGAAFVITGIFQCQPISFYWTSWDKNPAIRGKCININALNWSNAVIGVVLDVWMLAIPLYEVFHLQLSLRKKISVALMFFVGTLYVLRLEGIPQNFLIRFQCYSNISCPSTVSGNLCRLVESDLESSRRHHLVTYRDWGRHCMRLHARPSCHPQPHVPYASWHDHGQKSAILCEPPRSHQQ